MLLPSCCSCTPAPPSALSTMMNWPALALLISPPVAPARLKFTAEPMTTKFCAFAWKVQESGAIGPAVTMTSVAPALGEGRRLAGGHRGSTRGRVGPVGAEVVVGSRGRAPGAAPGVALRGRRQRHGGQRRAGEQRRAQDGVTASVVAPPQCRAPAPHGAPRLDSPPASPRGRHFTRHSRAGQSLAHRWRRLRDDAPAVLGLQQGEIVDEEARRQRTFDLGEGRHRAGLVDRHDAVVARVSLRLRRGTRAHHVEPFVARHVGDFAVLFRIEMRHRVKRRGDLVGIAFVQSVEIGPERLLDRGGFAGHVPSLIVR